MKGSENQRHSESVVVDNFTQINGCTHFLEYSHSNTHTASAIVILGVLIKLSKRGQC